MKRILAIIMVLALVAGSYAVGYATSPRQFDVGIEVIAPPPGLVIIGDPFFNGTVAQGEELPFDVRLQNESTSAITFQVTITGTLPAGFIVTEPGCCLYTILAGNQVLYNWKVIIEDIVPAGNYQFTLVFDDPIGG